ncbi:MAG: hypothetical protein ACOC47_10765 [Alkalispirochaetaceae bacterium]
MTVEKYIVLGLLISTISTLLLSQRLLIDDEKSHEALWAAPFWISFFPFFASSIALGAIVYPASQGLLSRPVFEIVAQVGAVLAGVLLVSYGTWLVIYYRGDP